MNLLDFIWPHVGKMPSDQSLKTDLENISAATWELEPQTFLDEARRLRDIETARKASAETKSQIYIAALFALLPIQVSLTEHDALQGVMAFEKWYQTTGFIFFGLGFIYGVGAFVSSFRALVVRPFHRVDVKDIVAVSSPQELAREILKSVRLDRRMVNHKVSFVIVTHKLVFRMAILQLCAVVVIYFGQSISELIKFISVYFFD